MINKQTVDKHILSNYGVIIHTDHVTPQIWWLEIDQIRTRKYWDCVEIMKIASNINNYWNKVTP